MESSEAGTSTNNQFGEEYQMFLSFRGCDTRRGFTNSLYHALVDTGIRVFIDDEELRPGEEISEELLQAIDDSKLYIPIFSKRYASSHWCLRELAKMVKNTSKSKEDGKKKIILPIFYDVTPDDVKLKTKLYRGAISNLEQMMVDQKRKFNSEDLEMWQKALKEVAGMKGWELEKYSGEGDLIKTVVNEVMVRLKTRQRPVTKDLVGMENRIAAIDNLLDIDSEDVRLIGICGMGGIGKTTLAKFIFNKLCPYFGKYCSFLDDVREAAKTKRLVKLQKKLLSDISPSRVAQNVFNIDQGIVVIGETICNKKMLIVLDDVDEGNQIQILIGENSLYPGTRILVTTRNKNVLKIRRFKYEILSFEMEGLSEKDGLQLFSMHAFDDSSPPANYHTLSENIVATTDGLPLALEAIGSSLFGQENKVIWEERLEKLRKTPYKDVLGKLRISYDVLEPDQKQIFLDIACFFIYCDKTHPMDMWKHCGFSPEDAIDVLIKRCMMKFNCDAFAMHDQFRDLGRTIAKDEGTRLWDRDDIICHMRSTEIKGSIQAMRLFSDDSNGPRITVTLEQIKRFPRLRYLSLRKVTFVGDFTSSLSSLKWINSPCSRCLESPNMSHLENLIQMELYCIEITKDGVDRLIKGARKLKVFTLRGISSIRGTPTFPEYSVLEKLSIGACPSLKEIDCSIGKLRCLTHLRIEDCSALRELPRQIGELQKLRHLFLLSCRNLTEVPDSVSKLVSLTELDVSRTSITRLPNFICRLPNLSDVDISAPIAEMPSTMSKFLHLQTLTLGHCDRLQELPELPESLTILHLRSKALLTVPNLSNLTNLVDLLLSDGNDYRDISNATETGDLRWIKRLSKLRKLHLCFPKISAPTTELGSLSLLKHLTLYGVDLPTFEQLPPNLAILALIRTQAKEGILHRICQLNKLNPKDTINAIRSSLRRLKEAKLYRHQEPLKVQLLDAIKWMERSHNPDRKSSGNLLCKLEETESNEVQAPQLTDRSRGATFFPSSLKMLQFITLDGCPEVQDIQFVSTLESLRSFDVHGCIALKRLGGLSNLKNLGQLGIFSCESLQVVEGIDELECLWELNIYACISMESVFHASSSKIPNECRVSVSYSGKLLESHGPRDLLVYWESYRETILNGTRQEASDSETEMEDLIEKTVRPLSNLGSSLFLPL